MRERSVMVGSRPRVVWWCAVLVVVWVVSVVPSAGAQGGVPVASLAGTHRGLVWDPGALFGVLSGLGVVPAVGAGPSVVYLATVDASGVDGERRDRVSFVAAALAEVGAGPLDVVTVPWGREDDRMVSGRSFPVGDAALLASGHGFLVGRDDLVVTADVGASVAELVAVRTVRSGLERLGVVDLVVCVDAVGVRAWATAFHRKQAFVGSLDAFARGCVAGELRMEAPGSGLGAVTGIEGWQALVFPSAFFGDGGAFVASVRSELGLARVPVPVVVLAAPTLTPEGVWVSAEAHAAALAEQGVVVDVEVGARLPGWVWELVYFPRFVVLVDPEGSVAGLFYGSNATTFGSMASELVRLGLF